MVQNADAGQSEVKSKAKCLCARKWPYDCILRKALSCLVPSFRYARYSRVKDAKVAKISCLSWETRSRHI